MLPVALDSWLRDALAAGPTDDKKQAERELGSFRERKRAEREKLEKGARKELQMKPKVSDTTLGALLPALQGKHGRAERSKAVRALNAVLGARVPRALAAHAFDLASHEAEVVRANTLESAHSVAGARTWLEPGKMLFSSCSPREAAQ